jgi:hypothetical protein
MGVPNDYFWYHHNHIFPLIIAPPVHVYDGQLIDTYVIHPTNPPFGWGM